ncbi:metallopeptidase family protein [Tessaracoccus sp. OS52]|uniref:metallopeptidase family protein n=1 Tax=Tessaracoccus sp. OS52 TaxID=2886691 RepID=UPI001D0FCC6A|nr:metallopeptidase family protein [Tessaracoccus sp. OS52]MCC2592359.1 metallopeptidase family protein [Tessaracoccus sp. OS52]
MPRSRDRHGRGIRGPLALPHTWSSRPVPLRRPSRTDYFNECVTSAMAEIASVNPQALTGIVVGVEDVPHFNINWSGDRVPMSAALEPSRDRRAQIVIYERPLEHRADSRAQLRRLVHRTIVEQLSALTGLDIDSLVDREIGDDWDD